MRTHARKLQALNSIIATRDVHHLIQQRPQIFALCCRCLNHFLLYQQRISTRHASLSRLFKVLHSDDAYRAEGHFAEQAVRHVVCKARDRDAQADAQVDAVKHNTSTAEALHFLRGWQAQEADTSGGNSSQATSVAVRRRQFRRRCERTAVTMQSENTPVTLTSALRTHTPLAGLTLAPPTLSTFILQTVCLSQRFVFDTLFYSPVR